MTCYKQFKSGEHIWKQNRLNTPDAALFNNAAITAKTRSACTADLPAIAN